MWVRRLGRSGPDIGVTALYMPLPDADRLEDRVLPHQGTVRKAGSGNLWACGRGKAVSGNLAELVGIDVPTGLLIGGKWTGGRDGGTIPVIDPATEDAVAEVAGRPGKRARRGRRGPRCAGRLGGDTGAAAGGMPAPDLRADDQGRGCAGPADGGRERQGAARREGRGDVRSRVLPLVRRGGGTDGR